MKDLILKLKNLQASKVEQVSITTILNWIEELSKPKATKADQPTEKKRKDHE